ncbi:MAG: GNAT family N-acetyltransferase, partial [Tabrizicola sp.]|nr:GNAT family N-acetyltransferase [Tabrizicola sp.]
MFKIAEETEADWWEVEALYDLCFAPGRTALSSYRLRDGVPTVAPLCLTLREDD